MDHPISAKEKPFYDSQVNVNLEFVESKLKSLSNYREAREMLKLLQLESCEQLHPEFCFCLSALSCYCYIMDITSNSKSQVESSEEHEAVKELSFLVEAYPQRYIVLLLRVLYAYKNERWSEALYYCEKLLEFQVVSEEEIKYRSCEYFKKCFNFVPEFDFNYCHNLLTRIQRGATSGQIEKLAELHLFKNCNYVWYGLDWSKLWNKELNDRLINRIQSYKKPLTDLELHKIFHKEILSVFIHPDSNLQFYYKPEYVKLCDDCTKVSLQEKALKEVFTFVKTQPINDSEMKRFKMSLKGKGKGCFSVQHNDHKPMIKVGVLSGTQKVEQKNRMFQTVIEAKHIGEGFNTQDCKEKVHKQTQTEKLRQTSKIVQTQIETTHIGVQFDSPISIERDEKLDSIKIEILQSNKNFGSSVVDHLYEIHKNMTEVVSQATTNKLESKSLEHIVGQMNDQANVIKELQTENKLLLEKNFKLQKLLVDEVSNRYIVLKDNYAGLKKTAEFMISNLEELQTMLGPYSIPEHSNNARYIACWQRTLTDIITKSTAINVIYNKVKSDIMDLNEYKLVQWPQATEIPPEAYLYIFNYLKEGIKYQNYIGSFPSVVPLPHCQQVFFDRHQSAPLLPGQNRPLPTPFVPTHSSFSNITPLQFWNQPRVNLIGQNITCQSIVQPKRHEDKKSGTTETNTKNLKAANSLSFEWSENIDSGECDIYVKEMEIFESLQKHFKDVPMNILLNSIVKALRKCDGSFENMSLVEIQDKVKDASK
ncbi:uncharacterized protein LOC132705460 isoform X2 [Cylas formicarius]|nr:uncharacterized protein LOC132705460 isoform X2 [Cylas formicarius]XP_060532029.1 uncharacterized protein LOC132705460 isoform X2 [Cylas formicarius]